MAATVTVPYPSAVERFPAIRQSTLGVFDSCPLRARFGMLYEQGWSSHPAARGQLTHRVLARCMQTMAREREDRIPVDVALQHFDEVLRQHDVPLDGNPLGDEMTPVPLREVASAKVTVKTFALYARFDPQTIAGVEKRLSAAVHYPNAEGEAIRRVVTGRLDLLLLPNPEEAIVADWKDTWGIPPEGKSAGDEVPAGDNVSEEGYFQQRFYALLVFLTYQRVQRATLREVYPRYMSGNVTDRKGVKINPVRQATVHRHELPDLIAEFSALVERFDRAVDGGVFRAAPGSHCSYCPRPESCTIFPGARMEGRIASEQDAEALAGRLQVSEARSGQIRKALRTWSNAHGPVPVRDAKRPRVYGPVVRSVTRDGVPRETVVFCMHTPEEEHPHSRSARAEEEMLLAAERERAAKVEQQMMAAADEANAKIAACHEQVACPTCGVQVGERCVSLRSQPPKAT